jgi:hypothetical protein
VEEVGRVTLVGYNKVSIFVITHADRTRFFFFTANRLLIRFRL